MDRVRDRADLGDLGAELAPRAAPRSAPADDHRTKRPRACAQLSRMPRGRLPQACRRSVLAALTGVVCLIVASPAVAHQPHVVGDAARVVVSDPEISKAYYGRLPGVPARYEIVSRRPFTLYAQITVPDIRGDDQPISHGVDRRGLIGSGAFAPNTARGCPPAWIAIARHGARQVGPRRVGAHSGWRIALAARVRSPHTEARSVLRTDAQRRPGRKVGGDQGGIQCHRPRPGMHSVACSR